ncbi:MAG: YceD family protein [Longimicrobiales bacterium]
MLKVDLRQLARKRRIRIDQTVADDHPQWRQNGITLAEPLEVRLEVQFAGRDVVVRGSLQSRVALSCRRCLVPVTVELNEPIALLFRPGLTRVEAEAQEVYCLPERADDLDLADAICEQVVLAVPQYAMCRESCRGLCAQCGVNLNQTQCSCDAAELDPRWAALRNLRTD